MSEDNTTTEIEAVEPEPVKKTTRRPKATKPEVVAEAPEKVEYEFLEELPNEQQAAPVTEVAEPQRDTRITKAIDGDETEPQKVEADKAFDLETAVGVPAIDGKPEPEPAPAKVDQPKIDGVAKGDTRVTAYIEEGETEPKPVKYEDTFAEDHHDQPNPGKVGGEPVETDPDVLAAPMESKTETPAKGDKPKTTNPKLKRLKKYRDD